MPYEIVEKEKLPKRECETIIQVVENNHPMKPWTLASTVNEQLSNTTTEEIHSLIGKLTLKGVLTPDANGNLTLLHDEIIEDITK